MPCIQRLSSLSIRDQEEMRFPYAMRDLPLLSHSGELHHIPGHCETEGNETPTNGRHHSLPGTPSLARTIPFHPGEFQHLSLRKQIVSQVSLDSPLSPSMRPRSPWGRFDPYDSPEDQDKEYVGFATLPNQVHRKTVKKGFTFTLIVAGESSLIPVSVNPHSLTVCSSRTFTKTEKFLMLKVRFSFSVSVWKKTESDGEKGIKLRLTIIDTPGFGDAINNTESWRHVEDYIDQQFEQYFRDESGLNRRNIQDNRVHCCLYFISPFGHGLRPLDVDCMRALHEKVNIIPVLAKADSLTPAEVCRKKMKIREEIKQFGINIYQFPECDSDEDEDFKTQEQILKNSIPFAVIGSNVQVESKGRKFRGRVYPWGVVEVENPAHSDFLLLRNMLVRTHMQDLKDVTREIHYENYRAQCIQNMTRMVVLERKRRWDGSEADFPLPLAITDTEKERLIYEKDEELRKMQEVLERIQEQMQHSQRGGC
uniref:Septin-7 n=1 Tax=Amphilophus citrinellus TaxID=61819 RepID=A0A3Q0SIU3_AMPCI